jgi:hypothetical protein
MLLSATGYDLKDISILSTTSQPTYLPKIDLCVIPPTSNMVFQMIFSKRVLHQNFMFIFISQVT